MKIIQLANSFPEAILEIGLRVGVIPLNIIPRHVVLSIFLSVYQQRVLHPLQEALSVVVCLKLRLIHLVRLV